MNILNRFKINFLTIYFILIMYLCGYIKNALIIFLIVLFHELGHIIITLLLGYEIIMVEIYPFGGITQINKLLNNSIIKDLLIGVMGIVFQSILFLFIKDPLFIKYNINILLFNLLPIIPLDGSKILFELLAFFLPYKEVLKYYYITSFLCTIVYFIINCKYNLNNYFIIILFLFKTINMMKNKDIFYEKFLLERMLYDIKYSRIKSNIKPINYKKDVKYYYNYHNHLLSDKEFLQMKLNLIDK